MRVSQEELREYVLSPATLNLLPFLTDAHILVEDVLSGTDLPESRKKLIEKALAAHLYTLAHEKGGIVTERVMDASISYNRPQRASIGLRSTRYGQMVLGLDTSGKFESLTAESKRAVFRVY